MSGSQKTLKVISIILIAWAVVTILIGAFLAAGSGVPGMAGESIDVNGTEMDMAAAALALGIGVIVGGAINLVIALFGLRGAKNPSKIGAFFALCIVGLVLGLVGVGMGIAQGTLQWTSLVSLVLVAVCTVLAARIKKQSRIRD